MRNPVYKTLTGKAHGLFGLTHCDYVAVSTVSLPWLFLHPFAAVGAAMVGVVAIVLARRALGCRRNWQDILWAKFRTPQFRLLSTDRKFKRYTK